MYVCVVQSENTHIVNMCTTDLVAMVKLLRRVEHNGYMFGTATDFPNNPRTVRTSWDILTSPSFRQHSYS